MKTTAANPASSGSVLNKKVYNVCFTEREGFHPLNDEFFSARKHFYDNGEKTVKVKESGVMKGYEGKLTGKISARRIIWKKIAGGAAIEESFRFKGGSAILKRNFFGVITGRAFFDRSGMWIKSEYFDPDNPATAQVVFKPSAADESIERFDFDPQTRLYHTTTLYPVPYLGAGAGQSVLNAQFGEPLFIVSTSEGAFCYCPREEALARKKALDEVKDGTVLLMPAWEVINGEIHREKPDDGPDINFPSLEDYVQTAPSKAEITEKSVPNTGYGPDAVQAAGESDEPASNPAEVAEAETYTEPAPYTETDIIEEPTVPNETDTCIEPGEMTDEAAMLPLREAPAVPTRNPTEGTGNPADAGFVAAAKTKVRGDHVPEERETPRIVERDVPAAGNEIPRIHPLDREAAEILSVARSAAALKQEQPPPEEAETQYGPIYDGKILKYTSDTNAEYIMKTARIRFARQNTEPEAHRESDRLEQFSGEDAEVASLSKESGSEIGSAVINGEVTCRGRTEQANGLTAYDGEYRAGKRDGFGSYYYKDGSLCYAGFWKEDSKDGLGVSFRNADHAIHISRWNNNRPGEFVSLFDKDGNLKFSGKIENGMKQGVGISYRADDGSVFIGKWKDNEPTGFGSYFDSDGNLLYTGLWRDGLRNGIGTQFDENGDIIFSGEWKDDRQYNGILYKK